jgi:hypothetical protein
MPVPGGGIWRRSIVLTKTGKRLVSREAFTTRHGSAEFPIQAPSVRKIIDRQAVLFWGSNGQLGVTAWINLDKNHSYANFFGDPGIQELRRERCGRNEGIGLIGG